MTLCVENLSFAYGERAVLNDISFKANRGELVAVLGRNGAGKSTLFKLLLGSLIPSCGTLRLDGCDLTYLSARARARKIAYIPQVQSGVFTFTSLDVVLMGTTSSFGIFSMPSEKEQKRAQEAMEMLGVREFADRNFNELSGGEQQLVLIARALAQDASCLIMDEPTSNLDFGNQIKVMEVAEKLAREGYLVLLSTHNPQHAMQYADRVLLLEDGMLAADGHPRRVLDETLLSRVYGVPIVLSKNDRGQVSVLPALAEPARRNPWSLYDDLVTGIGAEETVTAVHLSDNWIAVETKGGFGLAMAQPWPSESDCLDRIVGQPLAEAAQLIFSFDLFEASVGLAAVNCHYNRLEALGGASYLHETGLFASDGFNMAHKEIALVGHLRHPDDAFAGSKNVTVFERDPKPGDLPDTAEEFFLPKADLVLVTGSTISNKSLPRVLELSANADVVIAGPSVPMTPGWFDYGVVRAAGLIVTDRDGMISFIRKNRSGPPYSFGLGFFVDRLQKQPAGEEKLAEERIG